MNWSFRLPSAWRKRHIMTACGILIVIAVLRIVSTYAVFSPTFDERYHLGSGMEWLAKGRYGYDPTHPPLARIMAALGPFLDGDISHIERNNPSLSAGLWTADHAGEEIIFGRGAPLRAISLARLGMLPFFLVAAVTVWLLATSTLGAPAAIFALLLFTTLPAVLAHAGLATTDMAEAAAVIVTVFAFMRWLPNPTLLRSIGLGGAAAIALTAKFSAVVFLPACFLVLSVWAILLRFKRLYRPRFPLPLREGEARLPSPPPLAAGGRVEGGRESAFPSVGIRSWPDLIRPSFATAAVGEMPGSSPGVTKTMHYAPRAGKSSFRLIARGLGALCACVTMFLLVWAIYRFSLGPILAPEDTLRALKHLHTLLGSGPRADAFASAVVAAPVPAADFFRGIWDQYLHNEWGHLAYLLGETRTYGWWYFFPAALAVKTPLPTLVLAAIGGAGLLLRSWREGDWRLAVAPLCCLALLAAVLPSQIDIGSRYLLPVYGFLAIAGGYGAVLVGRAFRDRRAGMASVAVLCGWQVIASAAWHPDYLAYFNETAHLSRKPLLIDSDLDWGQDFFRLSKALRHRQVPRVAVALLGFQSCPGIAQRLDPADYRFPETVHLAPDQPRTGWVAVSSYALYEMTGYSWLLQFKPAARVGRSILLYSISDDDFRRATGQPPPAASTDPGDCWAPA